VDTLAISPEGPRGLRLAGELDLRSVMPLTDAFAALPAAGQATLDLSELVFIDSSGLHAIEEIASKQNGNGPLILSGASPAVARLLEITDLERHPGLGSGRRRMTESPDAPTLHSGPRHDSLAARLTRRRKELAMTQPQAARELDVSRTLYRLWELGEAKPAPDRWRRIARWLGVSVTMLLLAEGRLSAADALASTEIEQDYARSGRDWDTVAATKPGDFFAQARALIREGLAAGTVTTAQARSVEALIEQLSHESLDEQTEPWEDAQLHKVVRADDRAPKHTRDVVSVAATGVPTERLETARLLASELVTNSVQHGPRNDVATIAAFVRVRRDRIRVEVSDGSSAGVRPRTPSAEGGYGIALVAELASRWGTGRERGVNVTWFELDLPVPGS